MNATQPTKKPWGERWQAIKSAWTVFWYKPIAAERLALIRITTAVAVLTDMLVQQVPYYQVLFGPEGLAPRGYSETALLRGWRLTGYVFTTTDFTVYTLAYITWAVVMVLMAFGVKTRVITILGWLLTLAFIHRNFHSKNFGDSVAHVHAFRRCVVLGRLAPEWESLAANLSRPLGRAHLSDPALCHVHGDRGLEAYRRYEQHVVRRNDVVLRVQRHHSDACFLRATAATRVDVASVDVPSVNVGTLVHPLGDLGQDPPLGFVFRRCLSSHGVLDDRGGVVRVLRAVLVLRVDPRRLDSQPALPLAEEASATSGAQPPVHA